MAIRTRCRDVCAAHKRIEGLGRDRTSTPGLERFLKTDGTPAGFSISPRAPKRKSTRAIRRGGGHAVPPDFGLRYTKKITNLSACKQGAALSSRPRGRTRPSTNCVTTKKTRNSAFSLVSRAGSWRRNAMPNWVERLPAKPQVGGNHRPHVTLPLSFCTVLLCRWQRNAP